METTNTWKTNESMRRSSSSCSWASRPSKEPPSKRSCSRMAIRSHSSSVIKARARKFSLEIFSTPVSSSLSQRILITHTNHSRQGRWCVAGSSWITQATQISICSAWRERIATFGSSKCQLPRQCLCWFKSSDRIIASSL